MTLPYFEQWSQMHSLTYHFEDVLPVICLKLQSIFKGFGRISGVIGTATISKHAVKSIKITTMSLSISFFAWSTYHCWGNFFSESAKLTAWPSAVPHATMRLARPHSNASLPLTGRPVRIMSIALEKPIRAGNLTVPPSIKGTPVWEKLCEFHFRVSQLHPSHQIFYRILPWWRFLPQLADHKAKRVLIPQPQHIH